MAEIDKAARVRPGEEIEVEVVSEFLRSKILDLPEKMRAFKILCQLNES
ncbi:MAG: hypothetical protein HUN05_23405 [Desulfobacter sp.]|nr:MAG: hypothetical protein HUN05_23405 [Desulfobacter sp.]